MENCILNVARDVDVCVMWWLMVDEDEDEDESVFFWAMCAQFINFYATTFRPCCCLRRSLSSATSLAPVHCPARIVHRRG